MGADDSASIARAARKRLELAAKTEAARDAKQAKSNRPITEDYRLDVVAVGADSVTVALDGTTDEVGVGETIAMAPFDDLRLVEVAGDLAAFRHTFGLRDDSDVYVRPGEQIGYTVHGIWLNYFWTVSERDAQEQDEEAPLQEVIDLPRYEFRLAASRPGGARYRSQVRAIVKKGAYNARELEQLAESLALQHSEARHVLVYFFYDADALEGWDGTGTLRESDWESWIGRVRVDPVGVRGRQAAEFVLASSLETGEPREDVLRAER